MYKRQVYEPPFAALELAGAGKPERQYGEKVYPAEPPDWAAVHEGALTLAAATRDLRLAVWLLRSGCHLHGLAGAVAGLQLLDGLLSQHWDHVHPQLDASDNNSPLLRLSALSPLTPQESPYPGPALVQGDLRQARLLASDRSSPLVRDIELGLRAAEPLADVYKRQGTACPQQHQPTQYTDAQHKPPLRRNTRFAYQHNAISRHGPIRAWRRIVRARWPSA